MVKYDSDDKSAFFFTECMRFYQEENELSNFDKFLYNMSFLYYKNHDYKTCLTYLFNALQYAVLYDRIEVF